MFLIIRGNNEYFPRLTLYFLDLLPSLHKGQLPFQSTKVGRNFWFYINHNYSESIIRETALCLNIKEMLGEI